MKQHNVLNLINIKIIIYNTWVMYKDILSLMIIYNSMTDQFLIAKIHTLKKKLKKHKIKKIRINNYIYIVYKCILRYTTLYNAYRKYCINVDCTTYKTITVINEIERSFITVVAILFVLNTRSNMYNNIYILKKIISVIQNNLIFDDTSINNVSNEILILLNSIIMQKTYLISKSTNSYDTVYLTNRKIKQFSKQYIYQITIEQLIYTKYYSNYKEHSILYAFNNMIIQDTNKYVSNQNQWIKYIYIKHYQKLYLNDKKIELINQTNSIQIINDTTKRYNNRYHTYKTQVSLLNNKYQQDDIYYSYINSLLNTMFQYYRKKPQQYPSTASAYHLINNILISNSHLYYIPLKNIISSFSTLDSLLLYGSKFNMYDTSSIIDINTTHTQSTLRKQVIKIKNNILNNTKINNTLSILERYNKSKSTILVIDNPITLICITKQMDQRMLKYDILYTTGNCNNIHNINNIYITNTHVLDYLLKREDIDILTIDIILNKNNNTVNNRLFIENNPKKTNSIHKLYKYNKIEHIYYKYIKLIERLVYDLKKNINRDLIQYIIATGVISSVENNKNTKFQIHLYVPNNTYSRNIYTAIIYNKMLEAILNDNSTTFKKTHKIHLIILFYTYYLQKIIISTRINYKSLKKTKNSIYSFNKNIIQSIEKMLKELLNNLFLNI